MPYVSFFVRDLFNLCIEHFTDPNNLKIAKVIQVHNKSSRNNVANYNPISVQCNLGIIFENMFYSRIHSFFHKFSPLSNKQFCFRQNRNIELATLELLDKVLPAIENKSYGTCVFLDYKPCFDTISIPILFEKLERYGVIGVTGLFARGQFAHGQFVQRIIRPTDNSPINIAFS